MKKQELILTIESLIKNPEMINVQDENGKDLDDLTKHDKRVFSRGIEVGLSIALDIVKNS